jgi:hypothetical protein
MSIDQGIPGRAAAGQHNLRRSLIALFCACLGLWLAVGLGDHAAQASPGQILAVQRGDVVLRAAPRSDAEAVVTLTPDHRLIEFERRDGWVRVGVFQMVGAFGWLPADRLMPVVRKMPPEPEPEPAPPPPVPPGSQFRLEIAGSPAVRYRGECTLVGKTGAHKKVALRGSIPERYRFVGGALSCVVQKWDQRGRLRAGLYRGGRLIAYQDTAAAFNYVRLRSAGPWGGARATRGDFPRIRVRSGEPKITDPPPTP